MRLQNASGVTTVRQETPTTKLATGTSGVQPAMEPSAQEAEEAGWVQRARNGEIAAFDWLLTRYRQRALRLATHVLRRPDEAEDLVQEAFLRAFSQIASFRGDAGFYTWLYPIVVRLSLNRMRTPFWKRERDVLDEWAVAPDTLAQASEARMLVERLLDRLSPPLRAAFLLREMEGLEYAEIATVLHIPVGTVRSRLNAARAQLRELWTEAVQEANNV